MIHSNAASVAGICNEPTGSDAEFIEINMVRVAEALQAIRNSLSKKVNREVRVTVLSGYRSKEVNHLVGGSKTSAHLRGLAADIRVEGVSSLELAHFVSQNFPIFDQIILEFGNWVHIGLSESHPRGQTLTAKKIDGKTIYLSGLIE